MEMEGVMGTSKNVNPDSMTPMYKQIIDILSRKMDEGELKPGEDVYKRQGQQTFSCHSHP